MEVHLLTYDLSQGLARQMSTGLLGFYLEAVYHTSIEVNGREYVYDGGLISIVPGSSHLGQPMQRLLLGETNLSMDIIEEYINSLRPSFTLEAYDLFRHNCNNFSDTFSKFLVGKGIPEHIINMPQAVLASPMGRMLYTQLTQGINAGRQQNGSILGLQQSAQAPASAAGPVAKAIKYGVHTVTSSADFTRLMEKAKSSCAVVFFTSATCAPCRVLYPTYDALAEELGSQVMFVKVDISLPSTIAIASQYAVGATPTFVTFLHGEKENEWVGADSAQLRGNVRLLAEMAHPRHPHEKLRLPSFANPSTRKPVLYTRIPPLEKVFGKLGSENEAVARHPTAVAELRAYLEARNKSSSATTSTTTSTPDLRQLAAFIQTSVQVLPPDTLFAVVDLFRCSLLDPRISRFFVEEETGRQVVQTVLGAVANGDCPYAQRLVTLQMACNLFSTPRCADEMFRCTELRAPLVHLVSSSFLDDGHTNVRVAAASLFFNIALAHQQARRRNGDDSNNVASADQHGLKGLPSEDQVELAASAVEAISQEDASADALKILLTALGQLVYCASLDGDLADLLRALDAGGTVLGKKKAFPNESLVTEVGAELLGKGLLLP